MSATTRMPSTAAIIAVLSDVDRDPHLIANFYAKIANLLQGRRVSAEQVIAALRAAIADYTNALTELKAADCEHRLEKLNGNITKHIKVLVGDEKVRAEALSLWR
jgi:hypothetical protein